MDLWNKICNPSHNILEFQFIEYKYMRFEFVLVQVLFAKSKTKFVIKWRKTFSVSNEMLEEF